MKPMGTYGRFEFRERTAPAVARDLLRRIVADATTLSPRAVDKPLALYGAGSLGRMAREYFARLGIPLQFIVDVNADRLRNDPYWADAPLLAPDEVPAETRDSVLLAVCVATAPYVELAQSLTAAGWRDVAPFYDIAEGFRERHPLSNGWFATPFQPAEAADIQRVLDAWHDDVSRAHHLQFLAWRRLRQEWLFEAAPVTGDDRFFIPEVMAALTDDEAFADVGAHVGSVTQRFIEATRGRFRRIWAIEPDAENLAGLEAAVAALPSELRQRVEVIQAVIAGDHALRTFLGGLGYASQCCDLGASVAGHKLDDFGLSPTYLKLHLEGMELEALRGATETIERHRPILAATVYHNMDGLWRLAQWAREHLDAYRLLMRVHSWCGTGAVVYAIPEERMPSPTAGRGRLT